MVINIWAMLPPPSTPPQKKVITCSKLSQWHRSGGVFIVNFEQISHLALAGECL